MERISGYPAIDSVSTLFVDCNSSERSSYRPIYIIGLKILASVVFKLRGEQSGVLL
jgi:hypothetical protein